MAGVLLALVIPIKRKIVPENFRDDLRAGLEKGRFEEVEAKVANFERVLGNAQSPLHLLHPWVASWSCWSSRSSTPASL